MSTEEANATCEDGPVATSCLMPIDKGGLAELIRKGETDPTAVKTLKCRTVAEGKFRHLNYIRDLEPHIIDEPPVLLGDDTAPNPSEALLAALGSCLAVGIHANCVSKDITVNKLEVSLEADINITAVWGTGDTSPKPMGFDEVRVKVDLQADAPREELEAIVAHAKKWSPVACTYEKPVSVIAELV